MQLLLLFIMVDRFDDEVGGEPEEKIEEEIILEDIEKSSEKTEKEKSILEKELKDYPVLGEDNSIFETKKMFFVKRLFFAITDFLSNFKPKKLFSKLNKKKANDEKPIKDDKFILEGFEGVYYNDAPRQISKKKLLKLASIILGSVFVLILLSFSTQFVINSLSSRDITDCPYECCVNDQYPNKMCPGFATCQNNVCVLPQCPDHYECCSGFLYEEKMCKDEYHQCSDFICVQKECPYECCTRNDNYLEKACVNDGNCINNKCFLEPCPHECCVDEIDYDDKYCADTSICVDNVCKSKLIESLKKLFNSFTFGLKIIFG